MWLLIRKRLLQLIWVVFLLSITTFGLMKLAPGDPVFAILNADQMMVTNADQTQLRNELGFDRPLYIQYAQWMYGLAKLDLGTSYMSGEPVLQEMLSRLPVTFKLTTGAIVVMLCVSIPMGILSSLYPNRWPDIVSRTFALIGASIPGFWLGLMLIYLFSFKLQLLPSSGLDSFRHMIMPSLALGFSLAAIYGRLLRAGLLESFASDYFRAGRARGIVPWRLLIFHAFRAALLPVITVFGLSIGSLLGGAVVIEILFSWPGLGSMAIDAIFSRDYPVIQGYVLLTGIFVVVVNLLVDLSYYLLDPRIKRGKGGLS